MQQECDGKEYLLLISLKRFYSNEHNYRIILNILKENQFISLRLLDWLVTNYSRKNNVIYKIGEYSFNMFLEYKNQLKSFSKKYFDPFCRRQRIFYSNSNNVEFLTNKIECELYRKRPNGIVTTLAQLNAFRWFIQNKVIEYALQYFDSIEYDMMLSDKHHMSKTLKNSILNTETTCANNNSSDNSETKTENNTGTETMNKVENTDKIQTDVSSTKKKKRIITSGYNKCKIKVKITFD